MKFISLCMLLCLLVVQIQNKRNKILSGFKNQVKNPQPLARNFISKVDTPNQPKLILEQHLVSGYVSDDTKLDYDQKCLIKQGYLADIIEFKVTDMSLKGKPIFAVLNSHNIALFENENVNSLVNTVELKEIAQVLVPKIWLKNNHFCFQIIGGKFDKDQFLNQDTEQPVTNARMTLCGQSLKEIATWIQSFKDLLYFCQIPKKEVLTLENKQKIQRLKIDTTLQDYTNTAIDQNNNNKQEDSLLKEKLKQKQDAIKKKFAEIMQQQSEAKIQEQKKITIIEEERKIIEEKTTSIQEQKECLEEALETRRSEEIKISQVLISEEEESSEVNMVQSAKTKIRRSQEQEAKLITEQEEELKIEAQKKQNEIKKNIVQEITDAERSLDPKLCYSDDLRTQTISSMKNACGKLIYPGSVPDIKKIERCMYKPNFCNECCQHFIGVNHGVARQNCKLRCRGLLFPETFEEHQYDYVLRIPDENIIKDRIKNITNNNTSTDQGTKDPSQTNINQDSQTEQQGTEKNAEEEKLYEERFRQREEKKKTNQQQYSHKQLVENFDDLLRFKEKNFEEQQHIKNIQQSKQ